MLENDSFWDFYWETRLLAMDHLGKQTAVLAASRLIRLLAGQVDHPLRLLELGCGEGQMIGTLLDAHAQVCASQASVGVDYNARSLAVCRRDYPSLHCVEGDFTNAEVLASLGKFELVLLVNALHEVFSASFSPERGEVDIAVGKQRVEQALAGAASCLAADGWLILFDGLEPPEDPLERVHIRFRDEQSYRKFQAFTHGYHPFRIEYHQLEDPLSIELSRRSFTRYITKSIFLGKKLWETERLESYQYFTEEEYRSAFARQGLKIHQLRTMTMNEEKWNRQVEILSENVHFPEEHILILAMRMD